MPASSEQQQSPNSADRNNSFSELQGLLTLARQSLDGPVTFLVLPAGVTGSRIVGDDAAKLFEDCRDHLLAEIDQATVTSDEGVDTDHLPISTGRIPADPSQRDICWAAAGLKDGGALVACAPEPWEPGARDRAILIGFARLISENASVYPAESLPSSTHLHDLIAASDRDGVIGIDAEGRCRYINHTGAELVGAEPEDVISMPVSSLFSSTSDTGGDESSKFLVAESTDYYDVSLHRLDGTRLPVDLTVVPHEDSSGDINGAVVRFVDIRDQKAAAAAAEQSEARHQAFLQMTLDSVVTIDEEGRILEFNLAAEQTFRQRSDDVIGREISEVLISKQWRYWWRTAFESFSRDGGGPLNGRRAQIAAIRSDGSEFPADFTLTRIPVQDGWVYTLYIHDLTEEKWNERRRSKRYAVTHQLAETESPSIALPNVLGAICERLQWDWAACWIRQPGASDMTMDLTWKARDVDARHLERVSAENGFDADYGFLGQVWRRQSADWIEDLGESNDYRRAEAALACGFQSMAAMPIIGRTEVIGVIELHSRKRRERDAELVRMFNSLGSQIGQFIERKQVEEERVQILAREQAARAEAEAAERRLAFLAEASAQLSASLDYSVTLSNVARLAVPRLADYCAIDVVDEDSQVRSLELADVDPEKEEIGRRMHGEHPVDPESNHPVAQVLRSGRPLLFSDVDDDVLRLFAEDDDDYLNDLREIGIDSAMYVPLVARGRTIGVISFVSSESGQQYGPSDLALAQELTRRAAMAIDNARLYREAQDAVRVREEFLSIASHELKTPLTTVKGYGQILGRLLRRPDPDFDRLTRLADQLQDQLARFETLIADLLDVSRMQQRGLELRPEPTDLVALVRNVVSRFEYPAEPEPRHTFAIHAPQSLEGAWDPDRLDQVLTNLLSNAVKYSPDGGIVTVKVNYCDEASGDQVEFSVTDQGIGIPETEQGQLFRPFARSETVQRAISGVGLGLYISRQIVARHGGDIWLESAPGVGSRFVVRLPRDFTVIADELGADSEPQVES